MPRVHGGSHPLSISTIANVRGGSVRVGLVATPWGRLWSVSNRGRLAQMFGRSKGLPWVLWRTCGALVSRLGGGMRGWGCTCMEYKSRYLHEAGVHSIVCGPENDTNRETSQLSLNKNLNHRPVTKSYRLVTTTLL